MTEADESFSIGEVVWAKVQGFPWWPAQVFNKPKGSRTRGLSKQEYSVMFFGENSHAYLAASKLTPYQRKYQLLAAKDNSKKFREALASADHFIKTGKGSLLEKDIMIDSRPISLFHDKPPTTLPKKQKKVKFEKSQAAQTGIDASEKAHNQQKTIFQQLCQKDINSISQLNVLQLLEAGILSDVKRGSYTPEFIANIEAKLKTELLNKYQLGDIDKEQEMVVERLSEKPAPPPKKQQKKKMSIKQKTPQENDFQTKRLCILKLHDCLKLLMQRPKAKTTSVQTVERMLRLFDLASRSFKISFKRLLHLLNFEMQFREEDCSSRVDEKIQWFLEDLEINGDAQLVSNQSRATQNTTV